MSTTSCMVNFLVRQSTSIQIMEKLKLEMLASSISTRQSDLTNLVLANNTWRRRTLLKWMYFAMDWRCLKSLHRRSLTRADWRSSIWFECLTRDRKMSCSASCSTNPWKTSWPRPSSPTLRRGSQFSSFWITHFCSKKRPLITKI